MVTNGGPKFKPGQKVWMSYSFDRENRYPASIYSSRFLKRKNAWWYYIVGENFGGDYNEEDLEEREEGENYGKYA